MKRTISSPRRRRRLTVALVATLALALPVSAADAADWTLPTDPATWSAPADPAKWSAPDGSDTGDPAAVTERSSWT